MTSPSLIEKSSMVSVLEPHKDVSAIPSDQDVLDCVAVKVVVPLESSH